MTKLENWAVVAGNPASLYTAPELITRTGTTYALGTPDPKYLESYPDAAERLRASLPEMV